MEGFPGKADHVNKDTCFKGSCTRVDTPASLSHLGAHPWGSIRGNALPWTYTGMLSIVLNTVEFGFSS